MMGSAKSSCTAAVLLAAGMSRRMGTAKPLLQFGDKPLIARIIESLRQAGKIDPILVITGHDPSAIIRATRLTTVQYLHNPLYESGGMISSVQAGVRAVADACDAFFVVLADHLPPSPQTLDARLRVRRETGAPIVLPAYQSKHGHPVLISSALAPAILALTYEESLATIIKAHLSESREAAVEDDAILADIDTPDDYNRALDRWDERSTNANRSGS